MKKRVLFVIESLSGGGAEKVLSTIVKNIDKTKFDITVLTVVKIGVYVEEVEKYCTLISMLPEYEKLTNPIDKIKYKVDYRKIYKEDCAKIYKKYVKNVYDVEIAFVEGFVTKLVANSTNKYSKKYAWIHTDMIKNNHADDNYSNFEEHKKIYSKFDTIFAVSEYVKEVFGEKFGNEFKEKTKIQYNPVDSQEIEKLAQKPINDQYEKQVKFIAIGRFVEAKGFDRLVSSAYKLHKEGYEFEVWILGQGEGKNDIGQYIKEDAGPLALVADLNKVWVVAHVKEKDIPLIRRLNRADIRLMAVPDTVFSGTVYHVSELLDEETRSVEVIIECDNRDRRLKPFMYGTVQLTDTPSRALVIPTSAVLQREDDCYVLVRESEDRYRKVRISVSSSDERQTVVSSGLGDGDEVVTEGAFYLIDAR